jgi:ribosomal-protein-alanine N-acetyltransferase
MQTNVHIRALSLDDVEAWARLLAEEPHHDWSRALVHDELSRPDRRPHGAFVDERLVGAIAIQVIAAAEEVWILDVTVAARARRHGVGSSLVAVAVEAGRAHRYAVWLEVRDSNSGARALYARAGFAEQGRRKGYYAHRAGAETTFEDAVIMRYAP